MKTLFTFLLTTLWIIGSATLLAQENPQTFPPTGAPDDSLPFFSEGNRDSPAPGQQNLLFSVPEYRDSGNNVPGRPASRLGDGILH